jgi:hypothetical protein
MILLLIAERICILRANNNNRRKTHKTFDNNELNGISNEYLMLLPQGVKES